MTTVTQHIHFRREAAPIIGVCPQCGGALCQFCWDGHRCPQNQAEITPEEIRQ